MPIPSIVISDFVVTHGYLLIAILLRDAFKFDLRKATYANMIALLAVGAVHASQVERPATRLGNVQGRLEQSGGLGIGRAQSGRRRRHESEVPGQ